jgi:hypothetical protein
MDPDGQRSRQPSRLRPFLPHVPEPIADADEPRRPEHVSPLRPYLLTGGRVQSTGEALAIEAQVVTTEIGQATIGSHVYEQRDILTVCLDPLAVAEVAARLRLHLGVARVLVGDLVALGHLALRRPELQPHRDAPLLARVIRGLQAID